MKKILIILLCLATYASIGQAQSVVNPEVNLPKKEKRGANVEKTYEKNHRYYGNRSYGLNSGRNDFIKLATVEKSISLMKQEALDSDEYGDRKKQSLIKELDFALRKLRESDMNNNGVLDSKEQEIYRKHIYID